MYYTGQGVPQDFEKAAEWFRKAAGGGSPDGQYCLGKLYYYGQGVPQDFGEASKWLTEAGLAGKGGAQYLLAVLSLYGKGVPKNPVKAYFWALIAARSDDISTDDKAAATALRDQIQTLLTRKQVDSIQAMEDYPVMPGGRAPIGRKNRFETSPDRPRRPADRSGCRPGPGFRPGRPAIPGRGGMGGRRSWTSRKSLP